MFSPLLLNQYEFQPWTLMAGSCHILRCDTNHVTIEFGEIEMIKYIFDTVWYRSCYACRWHGWPAWPLCWFYTDPNSHFIHYLASEFHSFILRNASAPAGLFLTTLRLQLKLLFNLEAKGWRLRIKIDHPLELPPSLFCLNARTLYSQGYRNCIDGCTSELGTSRGTCVLAVERPVKDPAKPPKKSFKTSYTAIFLTEFGIAPAFRIQPCIS